MKRRAASRDVTLCGNSSSIRSFFFFPFELNGDYFVGG